MGGLSHVHTPDLDIDIPGLDLHPGEPDIHIELPFAHDVSYDVDHPEAGLSPLSPITIAMFITTFGGVGLLTNNLFPFSQIVGLFISTVSGVLLSGAVFMLYAWMVREVQGSSEVQVGEMVGLTGEVIAPIPENNVGEIVLVVRGMRARSTARAVGGQAISRGTMVEIMEEVGNAVIVRPKSGVLCEAYSEKYTRTSIISSNED
jgi:membrane protein implicated in regulation of membrane protease activity